MDIGAHERPALRKGFLLSEGMSSPQDPLSSCYIEWWISIELLLYAS